MITISDLEGVRSARRGGSDRELSLEDRINEEVRVILDAYSEEMRRSGAQYAEMFKKVKPSWPGNTRRFYEDQPRQAEQAGPRRGRHPGRIDEVGFLEDRNTIRQEARKALTALLTQEAGIDTRRG